MSLSYQIRLKNHDGSVVAIFDDFNSLVYNHEVNSVGTAQLSISGDDSRVSLFDVDYQIEVWRANKDIGLDWYNEWEGLCRTNCLAYDTDGKPTYVIYASSYLTLLSRRHIMYYAGTDFTSKSGAAEAVIKEFVRENGTSIAITGNGRIENGDISGLSVETNYNRGYIWSGEKAFKNLLSTIKEIAVDTNVYFDVLGDGDGRFRFFIYENQRGEDRTKDGLDASTGLNGAGNTPVTFSQMYGNMRKPVLTNDMGAEINRIFVLGQGQESDREVVVRSNTIAINNSPWNLIESIRNATSQSETTALEDLGDSILEANKPQTKLDFEMLSIDNLYYGKDYTWGDRVTAQFSGNEFNKLITGMHASVRSNQGGIMETINFNFGDVVNE